jgi:hypothetical protein
VHALPRAIVVVTPPPAWPVDVGLILVPVSACLPVISCSPFSCFYRMRTYLATMTVLSSAGCVCVCVCVCWSGIGSSSLVSLQTGMTFPSDHLDLVVKFRISATHSLEPSSPPLEDEGEEVPPPKRLRTADAN